MSHHHFVYEHCDIPEGMTLIEWRIDLDKQRREQSNNTREKAVRLAPVISYMKKKLL